MLNSPRPGRRGRRAAPASLAREAARTTRRCSCVCVWMVSIRLYGLNSSQPLRCGCPVRRVQLRWHSPSPVREMVVFYFYNPIFSIFRCISEIITSTIDTAIFATVEIWAIKRLEYLSQTLKINNTFSITSTQTWSHEDFGLQTIHYISHSLPTIIVFIFILKTFNKITKKKVF